jgi:hypothetical protein
MMQKAGDLEGWMFVKKELERFEKEENIPAESSDDCPAVVKKLQDKYRPRIAGSSKGDKTGTITKKYLESLEALKRKLTIDGKIQEALEVKAEIEKVSSKSGTLAMKSGGSAHKKQYKKVVCPGCKGSKCTMGPCEQCNGDGNCPACGGAGMRESSLTGKQVMCIHCAGKTKCRKCQGEGQTPGRRCSVCKGTGYKLVELKPGEKIKPEKPEIVKVEKKPKVISTSTSSSSSSVDMKGLDEYIKTVSTLRRLYKKRQMEDVSFASVIKDPLKHKGKICRSTVCLFSSHLKGVRVGASSSDAKTGGNLISPVSKSVSSRADRVLASVKKGGKVKIYYGVINEDNITLFGIDAADKEVY